MAQSSKIQCTNGNIGGTATVTVTRYDSSYNHSIYASFSDSYPATSVETITIVEHGTDLSYTFTLPYNIYKGMRYEQSASVSVYCYTYDSEGHQVGMMNIISITAFAVASECKPVITFTAVDTNEDTVAVTGDNNIIVYGHSDVTATFTATCPYYSTISQRYLVHLGQIYYEYSHVFESATSNAFRAYARDSRGYFTEVNLTKQYVNYVKPTLNFSVGEISSVGNTTLNFSGTFFNENIGATANTVTLKYRYQAQGGSWSSWYTTAATITSNTFTATQNVSGLDYTKLYTFEGVVEDALESISLSVQKQSIPLFYWDSEEFDFNIQPKYNNENLLTQSSISQIGTEYDAVWSKNKFTNTQLEIARISNLPVGKYMVYCHIGFAGVQGDPTRLLSRMYINNEPKRLAGVDFRPGTAGTYRHSEFTMSAIVDVTTANSYIWIDGYSNTSLDTPISQENLTGDYQRNFKAIRII